MSGYRCHLQRVKLDDITICSFPLESVNGEQTTKAESFLTLPWFCFLFGGVTSLNPLPTGVQEIRATIWTVVLAGMSFDMLSCKRHERPTEAGE
jgi:hypothetical protein